MRLINAHDVIEHAEVNGEDPEFIRKLMDYLAEAPTVKLTEKVIARLDIKADEVLEAIKRDCVFMPDYIEDERVVRHYENGMVAMNKRAYFNLMRRVEK